VGLVAFTVLLVAGVAKVNRNSSPRRDAVTGERRVGRRLADWGLRAITGR